MKLISKVVFLLFSTFATGEATNTSGLIWEHYTSAYSVTIGNTSNVQIGRDKHKLSPNPVEEICSTRTNSMESGADTISAFSDSSMLGKGFDSTKFGNANGDATTCELVQKHLKATGENSLDSHCSSASSGGTLVQEYIEPENNLFT